MKPRSRRIAVSLIGSILSLTLLGYNLSLNPRPPQKPITEKTSFLLTLLSQNNIRPTDLTIDQNHRQIRFKIDNITIYLSLQNNPYYQVQSLQNIIKAAKMKHKTLKFINLASTHPYATLQNN